MCGIAGIIDLDHKPVQAGLLLAMNETIAHRGPDDEGYVLIDQSSSRSAGFCGPSSPTEAKAVQPVLRPDTRWGEANVGLCHRRFSIIDLSAAGHQPFFDSAGSCCVVFNGEIYNYLEVRDELAAKGVKFRTQSDTEVLLEAYRCWGTDCFEKLNGFWAIALYDFKKKQLLLSRDRIGKKPLYWIKIGSSVYFASEIKALLQIPQVHRRRQVNEESIYFWLAYGQKDLNFKTCFEGIQSLPAGCWAILDQDFPNRMKRFWAVPKQRLSERDISTACATTTLRKILEDAVRIRLRADVPLSVELSGGLDSSTLVALAAQNYPGKITTYTVRFGDKKCNEEPFARLVARHYGVDYRVVESPTVNFWSQILPFTHLEEEPYHSPNLQTNQVIWAQMRAMGTKVSLNGAGGDENFAGYSTYYLPAQIQNLLDGRWYTYIGNALRYSEGRTNLLALSGPIAKLTKEFASRLLPLSWLRDGKRLAYFKGKEFSRSTPEPLTLSEALHSDMTNTLMPYWLRSGDRGYMGIPLEVRAPFLDYRVIDFTFRLPAQYLFRNGWHKWILRKAVEDLLPAEIVWRRQKMGFPFPYSRFYSEYREIIDLALNSSRNPWIDFTHKDRFRHDWRTLSFILWYEYFFNQNLRLFERIQAKAREIRPIESYGYTPQFLTSCNVAAR